MGKIIVDVKEKREEFVKSFEEKGLTIERIFSRKEVINSLLPITIDYEKKEIGRMGNVTCAAAAASCGAIVKEEAFWKIRTSTKT